MDRIETEPDSQTDNTEQTPEIPTYTPTGLAQQPRETLFPVTYLGD